MSISAVATLNDQALMAQIVRHDETALAALYDRYRVLAFTIALRITGDPAVAEEVLQDIFHAVWRSAGSYRPAGSVTAWLTGIARHRAIDATRAATFRARGREQSLEPALSLPADDWTEEQIERRLLGEHVRAVLDRLPAAQCEAIKLAYYGCLSQSEIAARLSLPVGTVKGRLRLGLIQLRSLLWEDRLVGEDGAVGIMGAEG